MKNPVHFVIGCLLIATPFSRLAGSPSKDSPNEIIVGLSPFMPAAERMNVLTGLGGFVLTNCPNGARFTVWDGWDLKTVCDLRWPTLAFDSPVARAARAASAFAALRQWFSDLATRPVPAGLSNSWAINLPEFLSAATAQPATGLRSIVIWGSPFDRSLMEPSFSMVPDRYPSDGHLTRSIGDTPFGVAEQRGRLDNTAVHWVYPSEDIWVSGRHRYLVTRWWSLYVAAQSGVFGSFSSDTPQVLRAAARGEARPVGSFAIDPKDVEVVMHRVAKREVRTVGNPVPVLSPSTNRPAAPLVAVTSPTLVSTPVAAVPKAHKPAPVVIAAAKPVPTAPPLPEQKPSVRTNAAPLIVTPPKLITNAPPAVPLIAELPTAGAGCIGIAAIWQVPPGASQAADVDLYLSPGPGIPEVFWRRPYTEGARHFRDIRHARQIAGDAGAWKAGWEYVEVRHTDLSKVRVWLNVYHTRAPVHGIVRVQWRGRTMDQPFAFKLTRGNGGRDSDLTSRRHSPYWQEVRLDALFPTALSVTETR